MNSDLNNALEEFKKKFPSYEKTRILDDLRVSEFSRLDKNNHVYLDYTGGGLYADKQVQSHMELLKDNVFGNPHSLNPTSLAMTKIVEQARRYVLDFFNADPDEYSAIFSLNATGAIKIVAESYPFGSDDHFLLTFDNHNSVNGIREYARSKNAKITYAPLHLPEMSIDEKKLLKFLSMAEPKGNNLFAYPAQSNFSGVQHSLEWIDKAHSNGWDVLLDAAAFAPTNKLDLSKWKPDYVPLSFYKVFGYPTGVGCLIALKSSLAKLRKPWFAGGTITVASVQGDKYYLAEGEAAFEDGTVNYLSLPAIEIGLKMITEIGIETIHERVMCLIGWLLENLLALKHSTGTPIIRIYGPEDTANRGGAITMNFYDPQGNFIDHTLIEQVANKANISLRTGCFCNPGGGESALGISKTELSACFNQPQERLTLDDFRMCIDNKSTGAVRVSVGLASNFSDVFRFVGFVKKMINKSTADLS